MKKPTLWQRFRYRFDNMMSKGTVSLLIILGIITTIVVVTGGLLAMALGGADGSGEETLGASAARYGEIAIGYKKFAEDGSFTIEVNPRSREATMFSDQDDLIVVAV